MIGAHQSPLIIVIDTWFIFVKPNGRVPQDEVFIFFERETRKMSTITSLQKNHLT